MQGDVVQIYSIWGTLLVEYDYDAWGNCTVVYEHSSYGDLAEINPIRYRGYVYDFETGFYYLNSRYYDPQVKRFINADDASLLGVNGDFASFNFYSYCGNNPVTRADDCGTFWNFVIGGVVGGLMGGISAAISSYSTTGSVDVGSVILGTVTGAIGGVIGASGLCAVGQAVASGLLGIANNVGSTLVSGGDLSDVDVVDALVDGAIGAAGSMLGSKLTESASNAATNMVKKGINKVVTGLNKYNNGSRYYKGALKTGVNMIQKATYQLNFAQGKASVIGSLSSGISSIVKSVVKGNA